MSNIIAQNQTPFDSIKRFDEQGNEFWMARDLMTLLGYTNYRKFRGAIDRAILSCQAQGINPEDHYHFSEGSNVRVYRENCRITRFGCYLIAQNGDIRKTEIAQAQGYFAVQTIRAEKQIPAQLDRIKELELEIELRKAEADVAKSQLNLIEKREAIVTFCPEPVQQKLLGYQTVEKIEYRDRIIKDEDMINDGSTINKTNLCYRYKILTKGGKPDYKRFDCLWNSIQDANKESCWKESVLIRTNKEFDREYLPWLDQKFLNSFRQTFLGENLN